MKEQMIRADIQTAVTQALYLNANPLVAEKLTNPDLGKSDP